MKNLLFLFTIFFAMSSSALADQLVTVPGKTTVQLLVRTFVLPMNEVTPGTELDFVTAADTIVDGWVVIPKGAAAVGHLVSGGGREISSSLLGGPKVTYHDIVFALDYVVSADGKKIKLDDTPQLPPFVTAATAHEFGGKTTAVGTRQFMMNTQIPGAVDHTIHVLAKQKAVTDGSDYEK